MAKPLVSDELWAVIEPLLPKWTPSPKDGPPRLDDRKALTGIPFVLKIGIPWEDLPCEMGGGRGMTCWRRLRDWQRDGTWDKIHRELLSRLRGTDKVDWSRALIGSSFARAAHGGEGTGPSPVDRGKPGSKHHVITDANGIPLTGSVTPANRDDVSEMAPLVNKLPGVAGKVGHPRRKPDAIQGDLAYDSEPHRQGLREIGIEPVLPEKGIDEDTGLGETRWPVERTLSWVHRNRRLRIRYERRPEIHQVLLIFIHQDLCECPVRRVVLDGLSVCPDTLLPVPLDLQPIGWPGQPAILGLFRWATGSRGEREVRGKKGLSGCTSPPGGGRCTGVIRCGRAREAPQTGAVPGRGMVPGSGDAPGKRGDSGADVSAGACRAGVAAAVGVQV